jgi:transmembrane protein EpsG
LLIFYIELVSVYIFSLYARLISQRNKMLERILIIFVIAILLLVSGLRTNIGDTGSYTYLYGLIGPQYVSKGGYEPGFILFFRFLKTISRDPQFMLFVTSLIINVFNIWTISKYPGYFELNVFMYITSGYYIVTMNGIRQSLAAAVLFACTNLIIKGKFIYYSLIVLVMCSFHSSAIVLIPVYFMVRNEAWSRKVYMFIALFLIALIFYEPLMGAVFNALEDTKVGAYKNFKEGGANIIRVAVYAVPVILAYVKREQVKEKWPESNVFVNMALLNLMVMVFSLNNWIFARFTIYFQLYGFILLAFIIKYCVNKKEKNFLYFGLVIGYLFFFWYEQAVSLDIQYKTNFKLSTEFYSDS